MAAMRFEAPVRRSNCQRMKIANHRDLCDQSLLQALLRQVTHPGRTPYQSRTRPERPRQVNNLPCQWVFPLSNLTTSRNQCGQSTSAFILREPDANTFSMFVE